MSDKSNPQTVQEKIDTLNTLIAWFDGDSFELEKSLEQFEKAQALAREIETDLQSTKNKITLLKQKFDEQA